MGLFGFGKYFEEDDWDFSRPWRRKSNYADAIGYYKYLTEKKGKNLSLQDWFTNYLQKEYPNLADGIMEYVDEFNAFFEKVGHLSGDVVLGIGIACSNKDLHCQFGHSASDIDDRLRPYGLL